MAEERKPKVNQGPGHRGMRGPRPKIENPGKLERECLLIHLRIMQCNGLLL